MTTQAETVELSILELERLTTMGVISSEISGHLLGVINNSRTGRLFGHDSAITYPIKLLEMTKVCSSILDEDDSKLGEIRTTVSEKFAGTRARRPTELNRIISSVITEISCKVTPSVLEFKEAKGWNWLASILRRKV